MLVRALVDIHMHIVVSWTNSEIGLPTGGDVDTREQFRLTIK